MTQIKWIVTDNIRANLSNPCHPRSILSALLVA